MTIFTHRPDTSTWTTQDHDDYQEGHQQGHQRANGQGPEPLATRPRDPYTWGIHDGYHGTGPVAHPNKRSQEEMTCDVEIAASTRTPESS